jgi:hypothetical protein
MDLDGGSACREVEKDLLQHTTTTATDQGRIHKSLVCLSALPTVVDCGLPYHGD